MNFFYRSLAGLALLLLGFESDAQTPSDILQTSLDQRKQQPPALPSGTTQSWFDQATQHIEQREYFIKTFTDSKSFAAYNRQQQLTFRFDYNGYEIRSVDPEHDYATKWSAEFLVKQVGRNVPLETAVTTTDNERLVFKQKGFDMEFLNTKDGMRQNFYIHQKPAGKGKLRVMMEVKSELSVSLKNNTTLQLSHPAKPGVPLLNYDGLKAWDANHKALPAHMEWKDGSLAIVVDDKNATYPVTIDPLNHTPDWTDSGDGLLFPLLNDLSLHLLFGFTVSHAGDYNADGIGDIIVGAPAYVDIVNIGGGSFNPVAVGAAFLYFGTAVNGPPVTPNEALQPTAVVGALFGFSVSGAGDINGDGADDIIVGAPGDRIGLTVGIGTVQVAVGRVYVYYGNAGADGNVNTEPTVSVTINLNQSDFGILGLVPANPLYGFSVSNAGDVDNDGFDDIVVGSPAYANLLPTSLGGRVDVYLGDAGGLLPTPQRVVGPLLPALFGYSVSTAGDVNNDGNDDIIVGAPASLSLLSVGAAYIFHGSGSGITATNVAGASTTLQQPGLLSSTFFGYSVSNAGDVNGDGFGDVIIGEPLSLEQTLSLQLVAVGKAHIYYGSGTGVTTTGVTELTSPRRPNLLGLLQGNLLFGFSVSGAGDLNCDGLDDVLVGEPGGTAISLGTGVLGLVSANAVSGKAYVFYGRPTKPVNSPSYIVQNIGALTAANLLGASVSGAGDINGDGNADFIVGAPNGTLSLATSLVGIVGNALGIVTQNSVGSAYGYFGCLAAEDLDWDNDGIPDAIDLDDDNDGTPDLSEYPGITLIQDPGGDADGDGIINYQDPDFTSCGTIVAGVCSNFDSDGDGVINSFDLDSDNDGIPDVIEAGGVDTDGDGVLDNFTDTDNDGLSQSIDANNTGPAASGSGLNAPDMDADGRSNSYDLDSDGDGISDIREAGLPDANNDARIDGFADTDGDGFANTVDPRIGHAGPADPTSGATPALITPADGTSDGRYDGSPTTGNTDGDLRFSFLDLDSDNDGITDNVEAQTTAGYVLPTAGDTDNDGLANIYDSQGGVYGAGGIIPNNQDNSDVPDYLDADTDNDTRADILEGHDINGNGVPDDNTTLTGLDDDGDGIDNRFDLVAGPNVTTQGMGNPATPGAVGPLQASGSSSERDWRNALLVLPIRLMTFTAQQNGDRNLLDWKSANEENFSHFEIERSEDGRTFTSLGRITGTGGPGREATYRFSDDQPLVAKNFYRLRMVDIDNKYAFSQVLLLGGNSLPGLTIFPNPVRTHLQLQWKDAARGDYKLELMNESGQVVAIQTVKVNSTSQVTMIQREGKWQTGMYILRVTSLADRTITTRKLLIE